MELASGLLHSRHPTADAPASTSQPPASGQHWQPPCVIVKKYTRRSMAEAPVIFTCTIYKSEADVRLACCLKFLGQCRAHELDVVVVDASPSEAIRAKMKEAHPAAEVVKQTAQGRKGAALREALGLAAARAAGDAAWLCWQEPEKDAMVPLWAACLGAASGRALDVVVPRRRADLFRDTYPVEQYHSCLLYTSPSPRDSRA